MPTPPPDTDPLNRRYLRTIPGDQPIVATTKYRQADGVSIYPGGKRLTAGYRIVTPGAHRSVRCTLLQRGILTPADPSSACHTRVPRGTSRPFHFSQERHSRHQLAGGKALSLGGPCSALGKTDSSVHSSHFIGMPSTSSPGGKRSASADCAVPSVKPTAAYTRLTS